MARVRIPLNNFSFGEVNPSLSSRTDNAVYAQSGETVENFYIRPEGGLKKRAGTWLHDAIPHVGVSSSTSHMDVRLEPFAFSDDEQYIIAFDDGGFTPYRVEPNDFDAIDNTFGDSLGVSQLERIRATLQYMNQPNTKARGPSGDNTTSLVKYKITLDPDHAYPTTFNAGSTMPIRRGVNLMCIDQDTSKVFYAANNVFLYDETYTGSITETDVGKTGLDVTVTEIKSGVNAGTSKYNIKFTNNSDICLKPEISGSEISLNPSQSFELFAQSTSNWEVIFREDDVKEIWTAGFGDTDGVLEAFSDPDKLQDNVGTEIGPVTAIRNYTQTVEEVSVSQAVPSSNATYTNFGGVNGLTLVRSATATEIQELFRLQSGSTTKATSIDSIIGIGGRGREENGTITITGTSGTATVSFGTGGTIPYGTGGNTVGNGTFTISTNQDVDIRLRYSRAGVRYRFTNNTGNPVVVEGVTIAIDATADISPTGDFNITHTSTVIGSEYVACPWTSSTLNQFTYTHRGDFMIVCHDSWSPMMIVRTALNRFELRNFSFDQSLDGNRIFQPYYNFQDSSTTLTPSGTTGSVTLTTSVDYFTSQHVGITLLIGQTEALITAFTNAKNVTASLQGNLTFQLDRDALKTANGSSKVEVTHALHGLQAGASIVISDAGGVGGISSGNINGTRTISEVIDENTYKFTAGAAASSTVDGGGSPTISGTASTTNWFEQSYSAYRGYPQAVTFHEDRLWFAGSPSQPLGIWGSRTGLYFNFDIGDGEDDDALDIEANIGTQSQIRHLVSNRDLQIFASSFEFFVPAFTDQAVTPANAKISSQTPFGTGFTKPLPFDGVSIFAQADGKTIRDYVYSDTEGAYVSNPISLLSSHMTTNVYQSAVLKGGLNQSGSYLFLMRSKSDSVDFTNTELLVYYQIRGDRRAGWVRWATDFGYMQSICVLGNRLFVACNRRSDTTKRFVLEEFTNAVNAEHCASPHMVNDSTAGTYLASKSSAQFPNAGTSKVAMFTSTNILLDEYTLSSGKIDVGDYSVDYSGGYIGFPFTATAKTQSLDALVQGGPLTGRPRRITKVVADLQDTKSVVINGTKMLPKYVNNSPAQGIIAVSERKEFFVRGVTKDPKVEITQDKSLPCQVDGIVVEVAF
tara:strand:- start:8824 stop:12246 length:3423 start_codon:yes stop_codon:yes gene_type:complete